MSYSEYMREANLIDGKWVQADNGKTFSVINPATSEIVGVVPASSSIETKRAILAASEAFPQYSTKPLLERVGLLWNLHDA